MKAIAKTLIVFVCLLCASQAAQAADATKRMALVIGNSAYEFSPLKNPVNDARAMAATLRSLGFEVIHLENASQAVMDDGVNALGRQLAKGGVGLFYFAGHGVQSDGRNYLIPVQARITQEADLPKMAVDAAQILERMEKANNNLNIVILDACRNNPFAKKFRGAKAGGGLAAMDAPKGSLIAFATSPGAVASDGVGDNGVYTKHLLENLRTPGLPVEQMFKRVRNGVIADTNSQQRPWETTSIQGDFAFAEGPAQAAVAAAPAPAPAPAAPASAQEQAKASQQRSTAVQVEFAMLRENGKKPPTLVQSGDTMTSGDGYFFHIKAQKDCYLYLFQVDATGTVFRLFPSDKFHTGKNPVRAKGRLTLPNDKEVFYLDQTVGKEEFYFLASQERLEKLEQLDGGSVDGILRAGLSLRGPAGVRPASAKVVAGGAPEATAQVQEFSFTDSFVHAISITHK